jgi:hypothetical protein
MGTHIGNLHGVDEPSPARELVAGSARQRVAVIEHHTAIGSDGSTGGDGIHSPDTCMRNRFRSEHTTKSTLLTKNIDTADELGLDDIVCSRLRDG